MTPALFVAIALAGGAGAGLRYLVDVAVTRGLGARIPWGVLVVNLTGAFALGVVAVVVADLSGLLILGTGLLGGYTTFSAVAVSTALLAREGRTTAALGYGLGTFAGSVAAAAAGFGLGMLLI